MQWIPQWAQRYSRATLRYDLIAGITLAAYLLPAGLADASLANLPPEAGLYACIFSALTFWAFCSSRHTAISVTSGISLLVGSSLAELAAGDPSRYGALAAATAVLVGILGIVAWLVRAGAIVSFISETVLVGFKCGIALVLISTQLPKLFGIHGSHGSCIERFSHFFTHLHEMNGHALLLGVAALAFLILGKIWLQRMPVALFVVVAGVAVSSVWELGSLGIKMLGHVPNDIPQIGMPLISIGDINTLLPLAMACFLLGSVETVAIGRMFALKYGYRFDPNREFLGLGIANVAAGLGQGFPVAGGMSQSLVNATGGARTPLSGLFAGICTLLVVMFLSDALRDLPQPVLAAIVLMAVSGLINIKAMKHLWLFSRQEFFVAVVALLGVVGSGILRGVLIGAVLSLALLIRKASRPHTVELGRVPGTDFYADFLRHPENERQESVFIFRCEGAILYFNADYIRDRFIEALENRDTPTSLAIFYLGMVPLIDLAGVEMLADLHETVRAKGITFQLAEARGPLREALRKGGYEDRFGEVHANQTIATVINAWRTNPTKSA